MSRLPPFSGTGDNAASRALGSASSSLLSSASALTGAASALNGKLPPSPNGNGSREQQIPPNRDAYTTRQVMRWLVPEQPIIAMYINPQQVQYNYKKVITPTRVKGGYSLQYWGEDLTTLNISGTTGTSGIEGINVLYDIYRNEQLMFDPYALMLQAERDKAEQSSFDDLLFGQGGPLGLNSGLLGDIASVSTGLMNNAISTNVVNSRNKPTLASLAFTVELYWSGEVYRGYFEDFNVTEKADNLGFFDYTINFKVTQKRGFRTNFLAWHKHPSFGQSNSGRGGPPHSYAYLSEGPQGPIPNQDTTNLFADVAEGAGKILNNIGDTLKDGGSGILNAFFLP